MKTIYLDSNYICHTESVDGRKAIETDIFDGKENAYIEGFRYIPHGETVTE